MATQRGKSGKRNNLGWHRLTATVALGVAVTPLVVFLFWLRAWRRAGGTLKDLA